jgi:hypothetical protein
MMDFVLVKPLFKVAFGFASNPAEGLEGMVSQSGEAATGFDRDGKGLVKLCLDGQTVQVLATLDQSELEAGVKVRKGDPLIVIEVDSRRNVCRVTRELAPESNL